MNKIKISNKIIGNGYPPLFLPDISNFFNQDIK